jgi:predicted dehydrogenase
MSKLNIGVLGAATIAERSMIPAILNLESDFNLVAIASRDKEKAMKISNKFHCEAITGYDNLLKRKDIEAVYIPLPTGLHKEWILKAINAGKHIYSEKSIAMNVNDAVEMIQLARSNRIGLMEGYMFQYHSQHQFVKRALESGDIGEIRHFSSTFCFPPLKKDNFRYDPILGGGAILDAAGYTVRSAFFILGSSLTLNAASVYYDPSNKASIYGSAFMSNSHGVGASLTFGFDNLYQCNYSILGSLGKITVLKAFTPRSDERTLIILETSDKKQEFFLNPDNHFLKALQEFKQVSLGVNQEKHFKEIHEQSEALTAITRFTSFKS